MNDSPYKLGQKYLIRTVTHYYVGRLDHIYPGELVLIDASWVADTGRFHEALKTGILYEVDPFINPAIISRASLVDATIWDHDLPVMQK